MRPKGLQQSEKWPLKGLHELTYHGAQHRSSHLKSTSTLQEIDSTANLKASTRRVGCAAILSRDGGWWAPFSHSPSALLKPVGAFFSHPLAGVISTLQPGSAILTKTLILLNLELPSLFPTLDLCFLCLGWAPSLCSLSTVLQSVSISQRGGFICIWCLVFVGAAHRMPLDHLALEAWGLTFLGARGLSQSETVLGRLLPPGHCKNSLLKHTHRVSEKEAYLLVQ